MPSDFDARAATWDDDPAKVRRAAVVADAIRATVPLGAATRLLEYGAGTGLVSQALAGDVGRITLAEPSTGMREVLTDKVTVGTLPPDARIWALDLATATSPPDEEFDLVVSVMTLHHIHDPGPVLEGFARLLASGGHVCIVDLVKEDGSFHADSPDFDGHHGFDRRELTDQLESAGFDDVRFERCHEVEKDGRTYPLFQATGRLALGG